MGDPQVQIPGKAVSDATDLMGPVRDLLNGLNLLGTPDQSNDAVGFVSAFTGPPQSVALIEAGATAASKWWAGGLGVTAVATWGSVAHWVGGQDRHIQEVVIGGAVLVSAAIVLAIGYLLASDVRGRATAAVATIEARKGVALAMIRAAEDIYEPASTPSTAQIVPLPGIKVQYLTAAGADEDDWKAMGMERQSDGSLKFIVVKGSVHHTVPVSELRFV